MIAAEAAARWNGRILRLIGARENAVHEMALPDGRRAALRLHRPGYQDAAAIASELWWCAALAEGGLPVPAPLPARDGATLVHLPGGILASAVSWCEGRPMGAALVALEGPIGPHLAQHHTLGQMLRRLHDVTAGLTLPATFFRPRWDDNGLTGEAPLWGRFWDHPAATTEEAALLSRARSMLAGRLAEGAAMIPIHADVLRENVLVAEDGALSLIDFDDSGWGLPLYDLGTCLSQSLSEPCYPDLRDALMAGYGTTDTDGVETMILARCCASVGWARGRLAPDDPIQRRQIVRAALWARHLDL